MSTFLKYEGLENKGNDLELKELLIVEQILLASHHRWGCTQNSSVMLGVQI